MNSKQNNLASTIKNHARQLFCLTITAVLVTRLLTLTSLPRVPPVVRSFGLFAALVVCLFLLPTLATMQSKTPVDFTVSGNGKADGTNPAAFTPTMAGSLDPTFGNGGIVTTSIGTGSSAAGVAIQPDGKIVVSGTADNKFALARYNTNGTLDSSFDGDGKVTTDFGGAIASSVAIQADGKILVVGMANNNFALARYNANGTLDSSFDSDGMVTTPGADSYVSITTVRLALQADTKIVICGSSLDQGIASYSTLIRYNANGSLDTSFGNAGIVRVDLSGIDYNGFNSVAIQPDGKILASGYDGWEVFGTTFSVARFNANGSLDSTFGLNGVVYDYLNEGFQGWVTSLAIAPDQKIVAVGTNYNSNFVDQFQINKYNPNGTHDLTFDGDGRVLTQIGNASDANAVAIQPDGKIIAAGSSLTAGSNFVAVARYNTNGSLDSAYGMGGTVLIDVTGSDSVNGLTLDSSGRAVLAGYANNSFCVIRLLGDGPTPTPTPTPTPSPNTPTGSNVVVQTSDAMVTFADVSVAGITTFTPITPNSAELPPGYMLCPTCAAYDIATTAGYTPPVTVCLAVPASVDQQAYILLKLMHMESSAFVDRTTGHFTDTGGLRFVCGVVQSLSPFALASSQVPTAAPAAISGTITNGAGAPVSGVVINLSGSQSRKTITDANGNYRFDNVNTDNFYTVTPSRMNYHFDPDNRSFSVLGNMTDAGFTAIPDGVIVGNVIDTPEYIVRQHYLDFLGREPDEAGFNFWNDQMLGCGADVGCRERRRVNVSAAYFLSIEFQQTGYLVYRIHKAAYGNLPGAPVPVRFNEFLPDTQQIGQGVIVNQADWEQLLENNKQAFTVEFVQRARFTSAFPTSMTPTEFVDRLFANADVTPAAAERPDAINEFGSANTTADVAARARVLRRVAENSTLAQQEFSRAFVLMQYFGYLRRNPNDPPEPTLDFQGYDFWLAKLNQFNGNFMSAEMVMAFLVSTEYRQRFGQP